VRHLAWFGVWLLTVSLLQPVNFAVATESELDASSLQSLQSVEDVNCKNNATRPNISGRKGTESEPYLIADFQDLQCMQELVSYGAKTGQSQYRNEKHWEFGSFSASGNTLSPIGTPEFPFSGYITSASGSGSMATISDLNITGTYATGLFGVIYEVFLLENLELVNFSVTGSQYVGSLIGSTLGIVTIKNCSVSGTVSGTEDGVGGLIGNSVYSGGSEPPAPNVTLERVSFTGSVNGSKAVGGLVGSAVADVSIQSAQVNATIGSDSSEVVGGLVGLIMTDTGVPSLNVDNAIVSGSILGKTRVAGVIAYLDSGEKSATTKANLSRIIMAANIMSITGGTTAQSAGLAIVNNDSVTTLNGVVNLAQYVGAQAGNDYDNSAAFIISGEKYSSLTASRVFRYWNVSSHAATYSTFSDGEHSTASLTLFNGIAVFNCGVFSNLSFWTNSSSMDFSTDNVWDFSKIAQGYLPSLKGTAPSQPYSCAHKIVYDSGWAKDNLEVTPNFGSLVLPSKEFYGWVNYFPANIGISSLNYSFDLGLHAPFDILYAQDDDEYTSSEVMRCNVANSEAWSLPTKGWPWDSPSDFIQLRKSTCSPPAMNISLSISNNNLSLAWSAEHSQSVAIEFSTLTNLAGGTPPGTSKSQLSYYGTGNSATVTLGSSFVGTYVVSASGSIKGNDEPEPRTFDETVTLINYLKELVSIGSVYFPDVFITDDTGTIAYKTIYYKNNDAVTVSQVTSVNASRHAAISWLASVVVTDGSQSTSAGVTTYRPQDPVNRGAMAQFLQKLAGFSNEQIEAKYKNQATQFTDIASLKKSNPARYYAILWLADTGITAGCNTAGTKFCPGNVVNRGAMAEFMRKFAGVSATTATTSEFPDVKLTGQNLKYDKSSKTVWVPAIINSARMGAINWLASTGITKGSGSVGSVITFRAQDVVNRGAMAEFMRQLALHVGSTSS
jgi:hypothetical protein